MLFDEKVSFAKITFEYSMKFFWQILLDITEDYHAIPRRKPEKH
jgi:hypothetical protein